MCQCLCVLFALIALVPLGARNLTMSIQYPLDHELLVESAGCV